LREAGGNAERATRMLVESPKLLKDLPDALATSLEQRLLTQP